MGMTIRSGGAIRCASVLALLVAMGAGGCRRGAPTEAGSTPDESADDTAGSEGQAPGPPPADWPRVLVIGPGSGPALYLGYDDSSPAIGYLNPGVRVRLESAPANGRIEVLVAGALATKAWVPANRIAAYAQERGRVEGTRAYVGPGDFVAVLGPTGTDQMRVEVQPWLGGANFLGPFVGTYPRAQLADRPPEGEVEGPSEGECYVLPAGQTVPVYERPGGDPIATLPALDPPLSVVVLRQTNGWFGVRAGYGPYVTGYVQGITPCAGPLPIPAPMVPASGGERPYWMAQERGALHRVAAGTRVRFHGETIARLRADGWARELGRQDGGLVDVFVAVNDDVALRGLVPEASLTLVEPGEAAPAPAPAEELPDELQ